MRISNPYGKRYEEDEESIEPKRRYFIACEGKKTEYQYFDGVAKWGEEIGINQLVEIIPIEHEDSSNDVSNPKRVYEEARKVLANAGNYYKDIDKFCLVVDRDKQSFKPEQYDFLVQENNSGNVHLFVSNPCIEFWFLLHLCNAKEYDENLILENGKKGRRTQTEIYLKDKLGGSYKKSNIPFENKFKDNIQIAIKNAKLYETDISRLKDSVGTNIGFLLEEMMASEISL